MFTCCGLRQDLLLEISSPAFEKSLSDGTEVPGMPRYFLKVESN